AILRASVRRAISGFIPLGKQTSVEVVQRSSTTTGARGCTFEDLLHLVVVILIETTNLRWFFGTLQLSVYITMLRAVVRFHPQAAIFPQLPLATESVRRLHQRQQQSGSNRADTGNLTQHFDRLMLPALGQKLSSYLAPHKLQPIQMLIEQLRAAAHPRLPDL